jgi:hypothetical protein
MSATGRLANLSIRSKIICAFSALMVVIATLGFTAVQKLTALNYSPPTVSGSANV